MLDLNQKKYLCDWFNNQHKDKLNKSSVKNKEFTFAVNIFFNYFQPQINKNSVLISKQKTVNHMYEKAIEKLNSEKETAKNRLAVKK